MPSAKASSPESSSASAAGAAVEHDGRPPLWLLPHALSLDAPAVAVLWQSLLSVHLGIPLTFASRAVLGLTVWFIYIADRLLDVRREDVALPAVRHWFYRKHERLSLALLAGVSIGDLLFSVFVLPHSLWLAGVVLALCVVAYLAMVHLPKVRHSVPKNFLVALLFMAGTFVAAWTRAPSPAALGVPAAVFFLLCLANLTLIDIWEARESDRPDRVSKNVTRAFSVAVASLAAACLASGRPWYQAAGVSAALLVALLLSGRRVGLDMRRALADVALMTPLLFLIR